MNTKQRYVAPVLAVTALLFAAIVAGAQTFTVPTNFGNGADIELTENGGASGATAGGNGTKVNMNARWNFANVPPANPDRNEWAAMRFDLSSFSDKSMLENVSLKGYMHRGNNNNSGKNLHLYALTPGTAGENWDEATTTYATMPGFTFDSNSTTNILAVGGAIVDLGTFQLPASPAYDAEGSLATITLPSMTTLIQGMGTNNLLTILITTQNSTNGQWRVTTKEASSTETGALFGAVGAFAPYLQFEMIDAGLPGDHNQDNSVDAADYVAWRKDPASFGTDPDGYDDWRASFGMSSSGGGGVSLSPSSVPEPSVGTMLLLAALLGLPCRPTGSR